MGRMITIPLRFVATPTADADFDILVVSANSSFRGALHMLSLTSNAADEEFLNLALVRRSGAGSGGTAVTEIQDDQGNTRAPSFTATHMVTTVGTLVSTGPSWVWGQKSELLYLPTPECREIISESGFFALNCLTSIASAKTLSGFMKIEEF